MSTHNIHFRDKMRDLELFQIDISRYGKKIPGTREQVQNSHDKQTISV